MLNLKDPARVGDAAHAFCILQTCLFAILVVGQSSSIFDSVWIQDGFCVANRNVAYMTSHDLCFYFDILGAIVCGYLYYLFKPVKGMESTNALFKNNIGGIASHGFAHFLIAESMRDGGIISVEDQLDAIANSTIQQVVINIGGIVVFWLTLLKASMANVGWDRIVPLAVIATVWNIQIPPQFGFTYVQTILLLAFSFNQLNRPKEEKMTRAYALYPMLVSVPLNMIAWMESTMCSCFIIHVGGHLIYDSAIVVSLVVYYFVCFWYLLQENIKKIS